MPQDWLDVTRGCGGTHISKIHAATETNTSLRTQEKTSEQACGHLQMHTQRCEVKLCRVIVRIWAFYKQRKLSWCVPGPPAPSLQRCPPGRRYPALFSSGINVWHLSKPNAVRACWAHGEHVRISGGCWFVWMLNTHIEARCRSHFLCVCVCVKAKTCDNVLHCRDMFIIFSKMS